MNAIKQTTNIYGVKTKDKFLTVVADYKAVNYKGDLHFFNWTGDKSSVSTIKRSGYIDVRKLEVMWKGKVKYEKNKKCI